ncbi:MAG: sigma-70 family RNA polymerase sigma factor [Pleurocapsa minor GSE-CHR-MK-17-07R]|jgi:RNA polymerase sigma-70 factor (ECF subfamily)|nr:sigma-70 family RNA polymerase sigma factor [Pleurocapsa minor GSE-CHR-MK 17-07R]
MPASPPENEPALIEAARAGSLDAFNALVTAYQDRVYTLAYRIMGDGAAAADLAQDAFITAYRKLSTYRGGNFRSWLMRITANTCYDALRSNKRHPATSLEDLAPDSDDEYPLPDDAPTPEQAAERKEIAQAIQSCISGLSPDQRIVLVLSDIEGMDYQAIADEVNAALGTVKSRISRARAAMRDCLSAFRELLPANYRL